MNRISLDDQVAVVTGGAQGLGLAIAKRLIASGARVSLWDRDADELKKALALLGPLLLRGPQTAAELRTNAQRLHEFDDLDDVLYQLARMAEHQPPLVACLPHGAWKTFAAEHPDLAANTPRIVDLSSDHRDGSGGYVYGLPEAFRAALPGATRVANPGCYPTAFALALMPAADREGLSAADLERSLAPRLEELTRLAALLATALEAPIEIVGERATLPYGESFSMRFVRESDGWKVEDPE